MSPVPENRETSPYILFVHGSAECYGSDKVLLNLARECARNGVYRPIVVLHEFGPLVTLLEMDGIEVHVATVAKVARGMLNFKLPFQVMILALRSLRQIDGIVGQRNIALVYSNTLAVFGGAIWARWRKRPHLWHVHEIIAKPTVLRFAFPRMVSLLADKVIANSKATQDWLSAAAPTLQGRSTVVFNGLPPVPDPKPAEQDSFRRRLGANRDDVVVTLAGRLNHWKGQDLLIEAVSTLRNKANFDKIHVALVGDEFVGHQNVKYSLMAKVEQCRLSDRVHFMGFMENIFDVWRATDIAVVPSVEPEPFGLVAIEAMSCEVPVIAAAHGGLLDIVRHGETGLLFEPRSVTGLAAAIAQLVEDKELRTRLGRGGRKIQLQIFSLESQMRQTNGVISSMLGKPPTA